MLQTIFMIKKKQEIKTSPWKQKSRAKYQCLPELEELIYQVNLIPPDIEVKPLSIVLEEQTQLLRTQTDDENAECSIAQAMNICLQDTSEAFQQHLKSQKHILAEASINYFGDEYGMAEAYLNYVKMRAFMLSFINQLEIEEQWKDTLYRARSHWDVFEYTVITVVKRGDDGLLHHTGLASLIGKFDDRRLRRCKICQYIYWAKRKDSKTCSSRCLNVLNVRHSRALTREEKEEKRVKREANRELIKEGKAKLTKRKK